MTNNITIQGRLAGDPELRFANSGTALCNISVPDQKRRKNDAGEWEDASATTWFRATVFGDKAEALAETAKKGDEVTVTGRLITREWTDKDGGTRSSLEIDYARVAVVPGGGRAERSSGGFGGQQADPWTQPQQSDPWSQPQQQRQAPQPTPGSGGGAPPAYDEPTF